MMNKLPKTKLPKVPKTKIPKLPKTKLPKPGRSGPAGQKGALGATSGY